MDKTSREQIDNLEDIEPVTAPKSEFEQFMVEAQPSLVLVDGHETRIADLEVRLATLEEQ